MKMQGRAKKKRASKTAERRAKTSDHRRARASRSARGQKKKGKASIELSAAKGKEEKRGLRKPLFEQPGTRQPKMKKFNWGDRLRAVYLKEKKRRTVDLAGERPGEGEGEDAPWQAISPKRP